MLKAIPALAGAIMILPVLAGLIGTALPAVGHFPAAGVTGFSLAYFAQLFDWPGIWPAIRLSVMTGFTATALSLAIVALILAGWSGTRTFRWVERVLSPLLSVPHAAAAFGLAFLIAPSGWVSRVLSPWATGWTRPPDILIPHDSHGIALTLGLVVKEVPFLLLMSLAALSQVDAARSLTVAQTLGYGRVMGWLKTVFPCVYTQIRLPVFVVLAFSMTVVDVALILGPNTPPPLAVLVVRWMAEPDLSMRLLASAAAMLQFGLVLAALAVWFGIEAVFLRANGRWIARGGRGRVQKLQRALAFGAAMLVVVAVMGGLAVLAVWSFAGQWRFPDAVPESLSLRSWARHADQAAAAVMHTMAIAALATGFALAVALGCLESAYRYRMPIAGKLLWIVYLPLLVPQVSFLPGLQTAFLFAGLDNGLGPVVLSHLVFVFPYVLLSLSDPFQAWNPRFATMASALGASPNRIFWSLRLPMLIRPALTAAAVGIAVSVGLYLPTVLIGGGRVASLTTEAVALTSGGDRRAIGVFALLQTAAALLPFAVAVLVPAWLWRNRRGLLHG